MIKVYANRWKNEGIDYGNDLNEMIRRREYDEIRGEMNWLNRLEEVKIDGSWNRLEPMTRDNQGMVNGWKGWGYLNGGIIWGTKGSSIGKWGAKDNVSKEWPKIPHTKDRKNGGKRCLEMERWCEGYCMEEGKECVFPKHIWTFVLLCLKY